MQAGLGVSRGKAQSSPLLVLLDICWGAPDGLWRPGPHTPGRVATAKGRKWRELASATRWEG